MRKEYDFSKGERVCKAPDLTGAEIVISSLKLYVFDNAAQSYYGLDRLDWQ